MATRSSKPSPGRPLAVYRAMRDFSSTPEPDGKAPRRAGKERFFCVQKHLASHLHYDVRLEHRGVLLSWAVPKGPSLDPHDKRLAMKVEDHPFDYGEFEGVIPSGYGAGIVMLWDRGRWHPESEDIDAALERGELKFSLDGYKLKGSWVLVRTGRDGDARTWLLIKHRDEWAGAVDIVGFAPLSVKSEGDFEHILAAEQPSLWHSDRPARGGIAGSMFTEIIAKAARLRAAREAGTKAKSVKPVKRQKMHKGPARADAKTSAARRSPPRPRRTV
ncbi:MAG: hypothetical protein H0W83_16830 [Planctomycetes bacterium]|nr:hypothetical protein [Planctomycetota bacterium]